MKGLIEINQIYFHETGFTVNDYGDIKREFSYPKYGEKGAKIDHAENFKLASVANEIINKEIDLVDKLKNDMNKELDDLK